MHEGALWWLAVPAARRLVPGGHAGLGDLPITGREAFYNVYRTADDRFLAVGALEPKFWAAFCAGIERPDLVPLQHATGDAQARVLAEVRRIVRGRTLDSWLARFDGVEACVTPVNLPDEALADRHVRARGAVVPDGAGARIRTPIRVAPGPPGPSGPPARRLAEPPAVGAQTDEVLAWAGLPSEARARLRAAGVVA